MNKADSVNGNSMSFNPQVVVQDSISVKQNCL